MKEGRKSRIGGDKRNELVKHYDGICRTDMQLLECS